jgi:hypothetical protein
MRHVALLVVLLSWFARPCRADDRIDGWVEPMRKIHARFHGKSGTFAAFGDSITVSLAFWAPLAYEPQGLDAAAAKTLAHGMGPGK